MTKRERDALVRKIAKIEERVGKKRDELRGLVGDMEAIVDSVREADEETGGVLYYLKAATEALDHGVCDKLSEYV